MSHWPLLSLYPHYRLYSTMQYPNEFLRPVQLGLTDFVDYAKGFLEENTPDAVDNFINLVLAGRLSLAGEERRVFLNALQGAKTPSLDDVTLTGDFDSLIGLSRDLPYTTSFSIFPVPPFRDTMKADNHLVRSITLPVCHILVLL